MRTVDRPPPVDTGLIRRSPALVAHLVVAAVAACAVAVAILVQADVLADVTTAFVDGASRDLGTVITLMAAVVGVRAAAAVAIEVSAGRALRRTRRTLRSDLLEHAVRDAEPSDGAIASRRAGVAGSGLDALEPYIRVYLPALTAAVVIPVAAGLRILGVDWVSAAIVAVTVPLIPIFMVLIGTVTEQRTQRRWAILQRLAGHFLDVLDGIPTLRLFGRVPAATASVRDVSEQYRSVTMGTLRIAFISAFALELIATLSVAVVAVSIGLRLASGSMDLAAGLVVLLLVPECYLPLRRVGAAFHATQVGIDASQEVEEILDRPVLSSGTTPPPNGPIEIRDVTFVRGDRTVPSVPVTAEVDAGSITALVGPSGAGKSSVVDAVRGRLASSAGAVTVGGIDVAELDPEAWADRLAVVPQRPARRGVTVRQSCIRGDAVVDDVLARLGIGHLGDRLLTDLSGGELRRAAVARAVCAVVGGAADVLVADEPTAHLDDESARRVINVLSQVRSAGAAVLVATHDPAVADVADRTVAVGPQLAHDRTAASERSPVRTRDVGSPVRVVVDSPVSTESAGWGPLGRILAAGRPMRWRLAGAAGLGVLAETCTVGLAGVAAWLVLRAAEQPALAELTLAVTAVRAFGIGKGVFRYAERLTTHDATFRVISDLRASIVRHVGRIAPGGIPGWTRGDVARRVVDDVDGLVDLFARVLVPAISVVVVVAGSIAVALLIDPAAGIAMGAVAVMVGAIVPTVAASVELRVAPTRAAARASLAGALLEYCEHVDDLVAARGVGMSLADIEVAAALVDAEDRRAARRRAVTSAIAAGAPAAAATLAIVAVAPAAGVALTPAIALLVIWPLAVVELATQLIEPAIGIPAVAASAKRTVDLLDRPVPPDAMSPVDLAAVPAIALADAAARWPGQSRDAYSGLDLDVAPGTVATISGPSGSGKSTVAATLVGFLPLSEGTYRLDGIDRDAVAGDDLRERVTWIEQIPWLADATVRDNLRIAAPDASDDDLFSALALVGLGPWVAASPRGLDTPVGRGGASVSGGEAQRIALARAILADRGVAVLDEPTAHLDRATAAVVVDSILVALSGRSVLILGHGDEGDGSRGALRVATGPIAREA